MSGVLRNLPTVNELLESPPLKSLVKRVNPGVVVGGVRRFLDNMRTQVQSAAASIPAPADLAQRIADWIANEHPAQRPVINATGSLLAGELGGPPLADDVITAVAAAASDYASVELDVTSGARGPRGAEAEWLLSMLAGAEAATLTGTFSGAQLLALSALAGGREVLVSRGHLGQSADGARIGDLIAASNVQVREVGATNCTRLGDYTAAVSDRTAAILSAATANFAWLGSHEQPPLGEVAALARRHAMPLIHVMESAALVDLSAHGLKSSAVVKHAVEAGADLTIFAGDGLVGGPECGAIVGRRPLVEKLAAHPLKPAVAADKLTLAALAATLRLYDDPAVRDRALPLFSLLATSIDNLQNRAERLAPQLAAATGGQVEIVAAETALRGVALPGEMLPTVRLAVTPASGTAEVLAANLRAGHPAVVARVEGGRLMIDLRSVLPRQDMQIAAAFDALAKAPAIKAGGETSPAGPAPGQAPTFD